MRSIPHPIRRIAIIASVILLIPLIGVSTAPMPPPYNQFTITGFVLREDGGSVENIPVVLAHLTAYEPDGYRIIRDYRGTGQDVALTYPGGTFHLSVRAPEQRPDTIAIAVVFPDSVIYFGEPIYVDSLTFGTSTNSYKIESSGYCKSSDTVEYTEGYLYSIYEQSVTIPQD